MRQTTSTIPFAKPKITESADKSELLDERRVHHDADSFLSWEEDGDEAVCHHVSDSKSQVVSADPRLLANGESDVAQNSVATPNLGGASFLTSSYAAPALDASNSTHSTASSLLQTPSITRRLLSPTVVDTPTFPTIVFETEVDPLIGSSTSHSESRKGYWKSSIREQDAGGSSGLAVFGTGNGETSDKSGSSIYLSVYEEEDRPSSLSLPECGAKVSGMWETLRHGGCFYVYTEKPLPLLDFGSSLFTSFFVVSLILHAHSTLSSMPRHEPCGVLYALV
ncbi:hypothetical protein FRC18_007556 [Serendipita sp. 400]|nr:hypothetical protein FRC18_007556 [Serendipita sp. 400]